MKPETYELDFNSFFDLIDQTFISPWLLIRAPDEALIASHKYQ